MFGVTTVGVLRQDLMLSKKNQKQSACGVLGKVAYEKPSSQKVMRNPQASFCGRMHYDQQLALLCFVAIQTFRSMWCSDQSEWKSSEGLITAV